MMVVVVVMIGRFVGEQCLYNLQREGSLSLNSTAGSLFLWHSRRNISEKNSSTNSCRRLSQKPCDICNVPWTFSILLKRISADSLKARNEHNQAKPFLAGVVNHTLCHILWKSTQMITCNCCPGRVNKRSIPSTGWNIIHLIHIYEICNKRERCLCRILRGKVITSMMKKIYA